MEQLLLLMFIFWYYALLAVAATSSFENLTFSLMDFNPNGHEIVYEGDASSSGGVLQLTVNQRDKLLNGSTGRATYKQPMHLWESSHRNLADFITHFSFSIDSLNRSLYGDGFTFFLVPNGSRLPGGAGGGHLGLFTTSPREPTYAKAEFLAIEFDTYHNEWDPYGNHIGVDLSSIASVNTTLWRWSDIRDGGKVEAKISYNPRSHNLTVLLSDERDIPGGGFPKNSSSLSYQVDLREYLPEWVTVGFSGSTGMNFEIHNIYSWNFSSRLQVDTNQTTSTAIPVGPVSENSGKRSMNTELLGIIMGAVFLLFLVMGFAWFWIWMKRSGRRRDEEEGIEMEAGARRLPYKDLLAATDSFNDGNVLGQGGFGTVYKGFLKGKKCDVAVKRITPNNSQQGLREFVSEVTTISKLGHMNLVELIGWCCENQEYLIVYKFMPNMSLDFHLFEQSNLLTWEIRYKIAKGLASVLHYLQEEQERCILHRDIKSSNILLDAEFNAKLGDFGLAKLVDHGQQSKTTVLRGTEGYVAPEYQENSVPSKESEIYSFGVVCLEIACGKPAISMVTKNGQKSTIKLVEWVWELYQRNCVIEAADPKLRQNFKKEEMKQLLGIGLACTQREFSVRPSIKQVIDILNFKYSAVIPEDYGGASSSASSSGGAHMEFVRTSSCPAGEQGEDKFPVDRHSSKAASTCNF